MMNGDPFYPQIRSMLLVKRELNCLSLANTIIVMKMGFTNVFAVVLTFLNLKLNLILVLAGPVSGLQLQKKTLQPRLTRAYS